MKCYESLGLVEHAQKDYIKVLEADPNFIQKTLLEQKKKGEAPAKFIF
jgi:hypothetical protein